MIALAATAITGPHAASGRSGREVILIDTIKRCQVAVLRGHPATVSDMAWSADGLFLCTASEGAVFTWSMDGFVRVQEDTVKRTENAAVAVAPDFGLLLTGGLGSCLRGLTTMRCREAGNHSGDTASRRHAALSPFPGTPTGASSPGAQNPGGRFSPRGTHKAAVGSGAAAAVRLSASSSAHGAISRASRHSNSESGPLFNPQQLSLTPVLADAEPGASSDGYSSAGFSGGLAAMDPVDLKHAWAAPAGYMTPLTGCLAVAQTTAHTSGAATGSASSNGRGGSGDASSSRASPAVVCALAGGAIRVARLGPCTDPASTSGVSIPASSSGISCSRGSGGCSRGAACYGPPGPWHETKLHTCDPVCLALHTNGRLLVTGDSAGGWALCALVSAGEALQAAALLQHQRTRGHVTHRTMGRSHGGTAEDSTVSGAVTRSPGGHMNGSHGAEFSHYVKAAVKLLLGARAPQGDGTQHSR